MVIEQLSYRGTKVIENHQFRQLSSSYGGRSDKLWFDRDLY